MDANAIASIAQAIPAIAQGVQGISQGRQSRRISENLQDPIAPIPQSAREALAIAKANASSRYMSGQLTNQAKLDAQLAGIMGSITQNSRSPQDSIAALTMLGAQGQEAQLGLGADAARDYERRQGELRGELNNMSGWENKQWETNVMEKFLRDSAAASALKNAQQRNMFESLKGLGNSAAFYAMNKEPREGVPEKMTTTANSGEIPMLPTKQPSLAKSTTFAPPQYTTTSTVPTSQTEFVGGSPASSVFDSELDPQTLAMIMKAFAQMQQPTIK